MIHASKDKNQRFSTKRFQTVIIKTLSLLSHPKEEGRDKYTLRKSNNVSICNLDWLSSPINILSIQEVIIRSNHYYYNYRRTRPDKIKHKTIKVINRNNSLSLGGDLPKKKLIKRFSVIKFKMVGMNVNNPKKTTKKSMYCDDFSILNQKRFFKRIRIKGKETKRKLTSKDNKSNKSKSKTNILCLSSGDSKDSSSISSEGDKLEDIYFQLLGYIMEGGNKQFIRFFEKNKKIIDINHQLIDGNTLLILAAKEGNYYISKYLCEGGIDINTQNELGNTALHYAIANQFYSIVDILTRHGAREDIPNKKGLFPWNCAENMLDKN